MPWGDHEEAELQLASSMLIVSEDIKEARRFSAAERWRNPNILAAISSWRIESKITGVHYAPLSSSQVHRAVAAPRRHVRRIIDILFCMALYLDAMQ